MYPYASGVYAIELNGQEIEEMIRFIFKTRFGGGGEEFYAWSKGLSISYNRSKEEVTSILYYGKPLEAEKYYKI